MKESENRTIYVEFPRGEKPKVVVKGLFTNSDLRAIEKAIFLANRNAKLQLVKESKHERAGTEHPDDE